jgi:histidinol-phosphate aminotransferase
MTSPENILRESVAEESGYSPQHDPADIVLDANESPYGLPESLREDVHDRIDDIQFNRYPDSRSARLRERMAEYLQVDEERLVAGNGSDELIGYLLLACVEENDTVLVPEPSFSMYRILSEQYHARVDSVPLGDDWRLTDEFLDRAENANITFIGSPNNPTGTCPDPDRVQSLLERTEGLVVVDEAYAEFSDRSFLDSVDDQSRLVVLRTLSKAFGLASARVGFLHGPEAIVDGINTVRLPYNINAFSQGIGEVLLENRDRFQDRWEQIKEERSRLRTFLEDQGFDPCPSSANFVLFRPSAPDDLYGHLLEDGIRIRQFSGGRISDYLRVTVGTPEQNRAVMDSLKKYRTGE